jgi:hypothetical protein
MRSTWNPKISARRATALDRYLSPWPPEYEAWPLKHRSRHLLINIPLLYYIFITGFSLRASTYSSVMQYGPGIELQFSSAKYCLTCGSRHFKFQIEFLLRSGHCPLVICYGRRKGPSGRMFTRKRYCSSKTLCHCLLLKYLCHFWDQWTSVR